MKRRLTIALAATALISAASACADIELGVAYDIPNDLRVEGELDVQVRVGGEHVYLWASALGLDEKPAVKLVGLNVAKLERYGFGAGIRERWGRLGVFLDAGQFWLDTSTTMVSIRDEAVVAALEVDHGPIPFDPEHTVFDLGDAFGARVGTTYQLTPHIVVWGAYRALNVSLGYDACNGADPGCNFPVDGSHWQGRKNLDMGGFELGVAGRF